MVIILVRNFKINDLSANISALVKKQLFSNLIIVASLTLFVKCLGFLKESVVASEFGLSQQLDTFYIAMLIPGFITTVFLGSFKTVFIPNYISEMRTGNNMGSFQSVGFLVVLGVSTLFLLFAVLITDVYVENFFAGHTEQYYHQVKMQFYIIAPCIIIWGLSSLVSGLLNINNEFKYSSLNTIFTPLVIIVCVLYFSSIFGSVLLAVGTLIGSTLNFLFLVFIAFKRKVIFFSKPDFKNPNAQIMFSQVPAKVSSGFLTGLTSVTDQFFAAQLAIGSIAALNYGQKMPAFITGLLIMTIGSVLLPHFSKKVVANREKAFEELYKLLKTLFIASCGIALVAILMSDYLVQLFFERNEFTSEDTKIVSSIQKITLLYAPFAICGMVLVNFLTSINKNAFMAWIALGSMLLNILLDYVGMKFYGVYGITIATTTIMVLRSLVLLKFTINQRSK